MAVDLQAQFLAIWALCCCSQTHCIYINMLSASVHANDFEAWQIEGQ